MSGFAASATNLGNTGSEVGPDLRTVTTHYKEALMADILMPNLNIESGYEEYLVEGNDGQSITGSWRRKRHHDHFDEGAKAKKTLFCGHRLRACARSAFLPCPRTWIRTFRWNRWRT